MLRLIAILAVSVILAFKVTQYNQTEAELETSTIEAEFIDAKIIRHIDGEKQYMTVERAIQYSGKQSLELIAPLIESGDYTATSKTATIHLEDAEWTLDSEAVVTNTQDGSRLTADRIEKDGESNRILATGNAKAKGQNWTATARKIAYDQQRAKWQFEEDVHYDITPQASE